MEIFKDIKGYEGLYQVSNYGNVKSLPKGDGNGYRARELKPDATNGGYLRVTLSLDGKVKRFLVHRLVAKHFIPRIKGSDYVNHIDNNPANNDVTNLEWVTHSQNMKHAYCYGRLDEILSKATASAATNAALNANSKMAYHFGERFVRTEMRNGKRFTIFSCLECGCDVGVRFDYATKHKGLCDVCRK